MVVHADLVEGLVVLEHNPLIEVIDVLRAPQLRAQPIVLRVLLEDPELVGLLLVHDEILTTDNAQILLVLAFVDGQDLIWLP